MSYDLATAARVRRILSSRSDVAEKRMVGGLSFVVGGSMCCGVTGTALMVRVGAEERDRVLAQRHVRPMKFAGRPLAGFVLIDPEGFRSDAALAAWVQRAPPEGSQAQVAEPAARYRRREPAPSAREPMDRAVHHPGAANEPARREPWSPLGFRFAAHEPLLSL